LPLATSNRPSRADRLRSRQERPCVIPHVLITGASSGIGAALAAHYAPTSALTLWGRDAARLEAVATQCRALGALVDTRVLDLTDAAAVAPALEADDARHRGPRGSRRTWAHNARRAPRRCRWRRR